MNCVVIQWKTFNVIDFMFRFYSSVPINTKCLLTFAWLASVAQKTTQWIWMGRNGQNKTQKLNVVFILKCSYKISVENEWIFRVLVWLVKLFVSICRHFMFAGTWSITFFLLWNESKSPNVYLSEHERIFDYFVTKLVLLILYSSQILDIINGQFFCRPFP